MLVFGLAMLYGGHRCFLLAWDMYNAPLTGDDYQSPVVKLPAFIGIALVPIGGLLALFAVLPIKAMDRFRPTMTMGDNDVE
jgi:TRAP-type C4-dicarboxylate transport system permease small subunit